MEEEIFTARYDIGSIFIINIKSYYHNCNLKV